MGRWGDGEMGRWGDGEMGRWGDGEMGRKHYFKSVWLSPTLSPPFPLPPFPLPPFPSPPLSPSPPPLLPLPLLLILKGGSVIQIEQKTYTTQDGNTVIVLTPVGRLDITTAWQFRLKLQECISKLSPHVVVNLAQANFIDSSGLTSLVAGMRDADKIKGSFRICDVHPEAKLVFEVTMMDSVFEIFETESEALEGAAGGIAR